MLMERSSGEGISGAEKRRLDQLQLLPCNELRDHSIHDT